MESIYKNKTIIRKKTRTLQVGKVSIGGGNPISVQTMTNTLTSDVEATLRQIRSIQEAGADIVRVSCPDQGSTTALKKIVQGVEIPIVADIHFHYQRAIEAAKAGASCLRINPGNIGSKDRVKEVIKAAKDYNCPIRIGVNAGSIEKEILKKYKEPNADSLVESALSHASILLDNDFENFKISVKASDVFLTIEAYKKLSRLIDCPLHIGITEAGGSRSGAVRSAIGLGNLLLSGIGDTIRVSLSADPEEEVKVAFDILKSLGLRHRGISVISCPSCSRQQFNVIETVKKIEQRLDHITQPITLSIIGCVVNGPGEARNVDIGFTGGGKNNHQVYLSGKKSHRLTDENIVDHIVKLVEDKVKDLDKNINTNLTINI